MNRWEMPEWMRPHRELFGLSPGGLEIEDLMTVWGDEAVLAEIKFSNALTYACVLMTAAKAELLTELNRRGMLTERAPAVAFPDDKPMAEIIGEFPSHLH